MACLTPTVEITRLLTNWSFVLVLENNASCTRSVCIAVANRKLKVFKLLLKISGLCPVYPIRICLQTLSKDLPSSILLMPSCKDQDDRLRLRIDKPGTMDKALSLACELEAFRLLDGDWRGSSPKVRSVEEADSEPDLFKAQMEMLRSDLQAQQ